MGVLLTAQLPAIMTILLIMMILLIMIILLMMRRSDIGPSDGSPTDV